MGRTEELDCQAGVRPHFSPLPIILTPPSPSPPHTLHQPHAPQSSVSKDRVGRNNVGEVREGVKVSIIIIWPDKAVLSTSEEAEMMPWIRALGLLCQRRI